MSPQNQISRASDDKQLYLRVYDNKIQFKIIKT